jgi:hypothetical protein
MGKNAAFHGFVNSRRMSAWLASLAATAMLFVCLGSSAAAQRPVGKDGRIHACYRVKGKPKGALRVVPSARTRCRRGERKTSWSATLSSSPAGGSQGAQGQSGPASPAGPEDAALKAQVGALTLKVQALEGVLQGITNGDLTGMLATLNGVTNPELLNAIGSVPLVEEVCAQTEELTGRSNALLGLLDTLDALNVLSLPAALPAFNVCPAA